MGFSGPGPMVALGGTKENGEPVVILGSDPPVQMFASASRIEKSVLERIQLEKFRFDVLLQSQAVPFEDVREGGDPPDFVVRNGGESEGLDCAALTFQSRRAAYQLFRNLRREIAASVDEFDFSSVAGCMLGISFEAESQVPPKRGDRAALREIVQSIANFPDRRREIVEFAQSAFSQGGLPAQLPIDVMTGRSETNLASFVVNVIPDGQLNGEFYEATGFECSLSMSFEATRANTFTELERIVKKHDQEKIDHLLVTIGGPDREGYIYPGEQLLYELAQEYKPAVTHLSKITLHSFMTGQAAEIELERSSTSTVG